MALGVFLLLFRDIIQKKIFPQLTKKQGFQLLILVAVLVWTLAIAGIGAWLLTENRSDTAITQKIGTAGTGVIHTGNGDVRIEQTPKE